MERRTTGAKKSYEIENNAICARQQEFRSILSHPRPAHRDRREEWGREGGGGGREDRKNRQKEAEKHTHKTFKNANHWSHSPRCMPFVNSWLRCFRAQRLKIGYIMQCHAKFRSVYCNMRAPYVIMLRAILVHKNYQNKQSQVSVALHIISSILLLLLLCFRLTSMLCIVLNGRGKGLFRSLLLFESVLFDRLSCKNAFWLCRFVDLSIFISAAIEV